DASACSSARKADFQTRNGKCCARCPSLRRFRWARASCEPTRPPWRLLPSSRRPSETGRFLLQLVPRVAEGFRRTGVHKKAEPARGWGRLLEPGRWGRGG